MKVIIPFKEHRELFCEEARELFYEAGFEVVSNDTQKDMNEDMLKEMIVDADAAVAGVEAYSSEVLSRAKKLRAIARFGVGTDNIDLSYCAEHGIGVARSVNHNSVAEFALTLMLAAMKNLIALDSAARRAEWSRFPMRELSEKNVLLLGFGRIGSRLARLIKAFDANLYVYDPQINVQLAEEMGVTVVHELDSALPIADVVSLHLPLTKDTYHLFNQETFGKMKKGAYFINTSRGPIVDEAALYDALCNGRLSGAGLDVFEEEPLTRKNKLIGLPNVTVTPHAAALSYETNYNGSLLCARQIINMCKGNPPTYPVVWR